VRLTCVSRNWDGTRAIYPVLIGSLRGKPKGKHSLQLESARPRWHAVNFAIQKRTLAAAKSMLVFHQMRALANAAAMFALCQKVT
jgi:hypothetical protein